MRSCACLASLAGCSATAREIVETRDKELRTKDLRLFWSRRRLPDLGIRARLRLRLQLASNVSMSLKTRLVAVVAGCLGAVGSVVATGATGGQGSDPSAQAYRATLDQYCVGCHNSRVKSGGVVLDAVDLANIPRDAAVWEKVVRKLNTRTMPPQGARRPDDASYHAFASWLETRIDRAAAAAPNPGRPLLHRLNRAEYANAIRDLLDLDVDVAVLLPPDDSAYGFDNISDVLGVSPSLQERYLSAAEKISEAARRRSVRGPHHRDVPRAPGSVAGPAHRGPAARHDGRHARAAHVPDGRRVRPAGAVLPDQLRQPARSRAPSRGGGDARRRPHQVRDDRRRRRPARGFRHADGHGRRGRRAVRDPRAGEGRAAHGGRQLRREPRARRHDATAAVPAQLGRHPRLDRAAAPGSRDDHRAVQRRRARRHAGPSTDLRLQTGRSRKRSCLCEADHRGARAPRLPAAGEGRGPAADSRFLQVVPARRISSAASRARSS